MKFQLLSDLHLEFCPLNLSAGQNLLLAGDIMTVNPLRPETTDKQSIKLRDRFMRFLQQDCNNYGRVFWIAGNHEHYGSYWQDTIGIMKEAVKGTNVRVLDKEWVDLGDDVVLFGATLWTNFNNRDSMAMMIAGRGMNDYNLIHDRSTHRPINPHYTADEFDIAFASLKFCLSENKGKKIVVMTHHTPCELSIHKRYAFNALNWAYTTRLGEFILDNPDIKVWAHGHTHDSFDYKVGETRVLCNPRGYAHMNMELFAAPSVNENNLFDRNFTFEVL